MNDLNPFTVEHIAAGVVRECSADDTLYIYNVENNNPITINKWLSSVKETISAWRPQKPCLLMHDIHKIGQFPFSRALIEQMDEIYLFRPELERYVAYVSPNGDRTENLFIISHSLNFNSKHNAHWKLFHSRREALNWLISLRNERQ